MNKSLLVLFSIFFLSANAQETHTINLKTSPIKVKVFLEGAQIFREASPQIIKG